MTDKELIRRLLRIPANRIRGKTMVEIVNSLPGKRAELVKEICLLLPVKIGPTLRRKTDPSDRNLSNQTFRFLNTPL